MPSGSEIEVTDSESNFVIGLMTEFKGLYDAWKQGVLKFLVGRLTFCFHCSVADFIGCQNSLEQILHLELRLERKSEKDELLLNSTDHFDGHREFNFGAN